MKNSKTFALTYKSKKETASELSHTDVFINGKYIGYFLPNRSKYSAQNENWNFVSKYDGIPNFPAKTKKELTDMLDGPKSLVSLLFKNISVFGK